jgi:cytoskeletal protein CcmA (bactofilin family)
MKKKEEKQRRVEDKTGSILSIIAPSTKFKGTISGSDSVLIAGHLKGEVKCESLVRIDREGRIQGIINSPYVIVEGEINGDIVSAEHVELRARARVVGSITTAKIVMAEGCVLRGEVQMPKEGDTPFHFVEKRKVEDKKDLSPSSKKTDTVELKPDKTGEQKPSKNKISS